MKKNKEPNGYLPHGVSHPSQSDWHYLTGFPNKDGYVVFRHDDISNSFLIFQQNMANNITAEIEIPAKELKDLAIWILRGIQ